MVETDFHTKDEIIKNMSTRCCVRLCKKHYYWEGNGILRGCNIEGLCRGCKTKRNVGTTLPRKEFPVIPYEGRTTACPTASFEYQKDLDNYLKIMR